MAGRRNGPPRTERTTEDRPPRPRQPHRDLDEEVVVLREQGQCCNRGAWCALSLRERCGATWHRSVLIG